MGHMRSGLATLQGNDVSYTPVRNTPQNTKWVCDTATGALQTVQNINRDQTHYRQGGDPCYNSYSPDKQWHSWRGIEPLPTEKLTWVEEDQDIQRSTVQPVAPAELTITKSPRRRISLK